MIFQTLCTKLGKVWQSQTMTVKSPFAPALLILIQTECVERIYNKSTKKGGERKLPSKSSKHCKSKPQTANKLDVTLPTSTNSKDCYYAVMIHNHFNQFFGAKIQILQRYFSPFWPWKMLNETFLMIFGAKIQILIS